MAQLDKQELLTTIEERKARIDECEVEIRELEASVARLEKVLKADR